MSFYSGPVPSVHHTKHFTLLPLMPDYTRLDFDALMASKSLLRQWSNSPWPDDDFTLEANRADLQGHYEEFQNGVAYAYTVLNPQEDRVEGCLYINPLSRFIFRFTVIDEVLDQISDDEAHMGFWIRGDRLDDEGTLFQDIMTWLNDDWQFPHLTLSTFDTSNRQAKLFEAMGMSLRFSLVHRNGVNAHFYHIEGT